MDTIVRALALVILSNVKQSMMNKLLANLHERRRTNFTYDGKK